MMRLVRLSLLPAGMVFGWQLLWAAPALVVPRDEAQLFVDDSRIAESHGLLRTLHSPRKENDGREPVLSLARIHGREATLQGNSVIFYDPRIKCWVMYCLSYASSLKASEPNGWERIGLVRFISDDGLDWRSESPDGVERVFPRTREDLYEPVTQSYAPNVDICTVWYDASDAEWPYKAWFWLTRLPPPHAGMYYHRSKDGRTFERGPQILVSRSKSFEHEGHQLLGPSDASRFVWDERSRRFLTLLKFYEFDAAQRDLITNSELRSRGYLFVDRIDQPLDLSKLTRLDLIPSRRQTAVSSPSDEYYDSSAYRYGSHWIGELKIWHDRGDYAWSSPGCAFLRFVSSTDGLHWRIAEFPNQAGQPGIFLANGKPEGANQGRNDAGYISFFCSPPLQIGDELIYYYGAPSYGKHAGDALRLTGGGVFRARLRLDGFVSIDAGQLTTPTLQFEGDELKVNSRGEITVELLAADRTVLAREKLSGDAVRSKVRFSGKSLRELAGDNPVKLRFTVSPGAALYSFLTD